MSKVECNKFEIIRTISVFAIFLDSINYEKWKMLIKHIFEQTYFVKLQAGNKIISTNVFKSGRLEEEIAFFIADSAQTEYCSTFHCPSVCSSVCHRRDISHFSHI